MEKWSVCLSLVLAVSIAGCGKSKVAEIRLIISPQTQVKAQLYTDKRQDCWPGRRLTDWLWREAGLKYELQHWLGSDAVECKGRQGTPSRNFKGIHYGWAQTNVQGPYTVPYFESENMTGKRRFDQLPDGRMHSVSDSTTADSLMKGLELIMRIWKFDSNSVALFDLINGVDAVVADFVVILDYIKKNQTRKNMSASKTKRISLRSITGFYCRRAESLTRDQAFCCHEIL